MIAANDTDYLRFLTSARDEALDVRRRGEEVPRGPQSPNMTPEAWQNAIDVVRQWTEDAPIPRRAYEGIDMPYGITVHVGHCCRIHGCKYGGGKVCSVSLGYFEQDHPCEFCDLDVRDSKRAELQRRQEYTRGRRDVIRELIELAQQDGALLLFALSEALRNENRSMDEIAKKIQEAERG